MTEKAAVAPAVTVMLEGWAVMEGAVAPEPLSKPPVITMLQTDSEPFCAKAAQLLRLEILKSTGR